ncbi:MAG TPA: hypothetical protein VF498_14535 [Anaerolineales bacterium]
MSSNTAVCPRCGQSDRVEKVSTIYLEGIGAGRLPGLAGRIAPKTGPDRLTALPPEELKELSRRLAPPASGKNAAARPIHPDYAVGAFTIILPVFLIGIFTSQGNLLLPVLLVVAAFYAFYFRQRKSLIARFDSEQAARQDKIRRTERAIGRWMSAYYCARDQAFFLAGRPACVDLDHLPELLQS